MLTIKIKKMEKSFRISKTSVAHVHAAVIELNGTQFIAGAVFCNSREFPDASICYCVDEEESKETQLLWLGQALLHKAYGKPKERIRKYPIKNIYGREIMKTVNPKAWKIKLHDEVDLLTDEWKCQLEPSYRVPSR